MRGSETDTDFEAHASDPIRQFELYLSGTGVELKD